MAASKKQATQAALYDAAATVGYYFRAYGSYGENRATAIRALRRRCPGFDKEQASAAFDRGVELYDYVHALVKRERDRIWAAHEAEDVDHSRLFNDELAKRFPEFDADTFSGSVGMDFYYWHLR